MASFSKNPQSAGDEGWIIESLDVQDNGGSLRIGANQGFESDSFVRFPAVGISQGATINTATLALTPEDSFDPATTGQIRVYGCDEDASAQMNYAVDFASRPRTTAFVDFAPGTVTPGVAQTINVKTIIQEIVDRPGYAGGAIQLVLARNTINEVRYVCGGASAALLSGTYTASAPATGSKSNLMLLGIGG